MNSNFGTKDDLRMQRIAGGSVIKYPPVFSSDAEVLFIIWDTIIRVYNTTTGQWIRDLDGCNNSIISIQCDQANTKLLYACTCKGEIISWKWKSGVIYKKIDLKFESKDIKVETFNIIELNDKMCGILIWANEKLQSNVMLRKKISIFDLDSGTLQDIHLPFKITDDPVQLDVSKNKYKYIAIIQNASLIVYNFELKRLKIWHNGKHNRPFTCVACHPLEEMIATGDISGRIYLWRRILATNIEPMTTIYPWHHTKVNTIAFTESGSSLYSGGDENVLVRWTIRNPQDRLYLPRMNGALCHIVLCMGNSKIAVATNDNGIQIMNAQNQPISIIQNFTWIANDNTKTDKFPIGLKINPRNSSLVLNGRIGNIQFYSTQTRSLLYNMDVTLQNRLNLENNKVLYNTNVTHTALNMNWMATAELLDDLEHTIDVRLKYWKFNEQKQTYSLNTQIELPHEGGVTALEFSSLYTIDNLLCASSGKDNYLKIWSLEDSRSIYNKNKVWQCIEQTNYKDLPINSLQFSQDSTVLAVGYGNSLCIYMAKNLQLKCVLNAPSGLDGSINKLLLNLQCPRGSLRKSTSNESTTSNNKTKQKKPTKQNIDNNNNNNFDQLLYLKQQKLMDMLKCYINKNDLRLIKYIREQPYIFPVTIAVDQSNHRTDTDQNTSHRLMNVKLTLNEKKILFNKMMAVKELNLFIKLRIFKNFGVNIKCSNEQLLNDYIQSNNLDNQIEMENRLYTDISINLSENDKYSAAKDFYYYKNYKNQFLTSSLLSMNNNNNNNDSSNINRPVGIRKQLQQQQQENINLKFDRLSLMKPVAEIKHIVFGTGDFAHLIIVCTEKRLLIWDLLTLRLKSAFKISVNKICVDIYTSLIAVFTQFNALYIFLPNGIPLYYRENLPSIYGAAWIPRRYPMPNSINLNWQASSQLFFLTDNQEIVHLVSDNDSDHLTSHIAYLDDTPQPLPLTPFGALIAKQIHNATIDKHQEQLRQLPAINNNRTENLNVKMLIGFQNHTMTPAHIICQDFLRSMLKVGDKGIEEIIKQKHLDWVETNLIYNDNVDDYHERDDDKQIQNTDSTGLKNVTKQNNNQDQNANDVDDDDDADADVDDVDNNKIKLKMKWLNNIDEENQRILNSTKNTDDNNVELQENKQHSKLQAVMKEKMNFF